MKRPDNVPKAAQCWYDNLNRRMLIESAGRITEGKLLEITASGKFLRFELNDGSSEWVQRTRVRIAEILPDK